MYEQRRADVLAALAALGEPRRRIVELAYIGFTASDIAEITGRTVGDVHAQLLAGMRLLHANLIAPYLVPDARR
jgi:DNA-directed RNA polymerase specialized sigma24 family protein